MSIVLLIMQFYWQIFTTNCRNLNWSGNAPILIFLVHVHVRVSNESMFGLSLFEMWRLADTLWIFTCTIMYVFSVNHGRWQDFIQRAPGRCRKIIYFLAGAHIMPVRICTCKFEVTGVSVLPMLAVKFSHWAPCINFSGALLYRFLYH